MCSRVESVRTNSNKIGAITWRLGGRGSDPSAGAARSRAPRPTDSRHSPASPPPRAQPDAPTEPSVVWNILAVAAILVIGLAAHASNLDGELLLGARAVLTATLFPNTATGASTRTVNRARIFMLGLQLGVGLEQHRTLLAGGRKALGIVFGPQRPNVASVVLGFGAHERLASFGVTRT